MADQDAQDINQMMSATSDAVIGKPKKSKFLWIVLGCVVVGVGLGVVVYQQSLTPTPTVKVTPKPTPAPTIAALPSPIPSAIVPETNVITQMANTMTFPEAGKLRVFTDLNNITLVVTITTGGQTKTITLPNRAVNDTQKMNFTDSTFEVTAGSTGTINAYLNSTSGPKMGGWILPTGTKCGANGYTVVDMSPRIAWAEANLPAGKTIFAKQCWADEITAGDPSSYDFNDFFVVWSYASSTTTASASPASSVSPSPSASPKASSSPSSSPSASPSPSASAAASSLVSPSPSASPRVAMPDTSEGTPVSGVFEITVGTVSIGLIMLLLGLFGLLAL